MARNPGVWLAAPLFALAVALCGAAIASADGGCVPTPSGIDCGYWGSSTSSTVIPGGSEPPLRYLATSTDPGVGPCWFWSRYPPGLDSWNAAHEHEILRTRWRLPECPGRSTPARTVHTTEAWEIFRSFPLAAPRVSLQPEVGITNLESFLSAPVPAPISHTETLPDGTSLTVRAAVDTAWVEWGDGSPQTGHSPQALRGHPHGSARHAYALKTCSPAYRRDHPSGPNCHPTLRSYPVRVTFEWAGEYREGLRWIDLGTIDRSTTVRYDVDEVVGVLFGS